MMLLMIYMVEAQEKPTNAFEDLSRIGVVLEEDSPMRVVASGESMKKLLTKTPSNGYFCFTESRNNSVRMFDAVPECWASRDVKSLNKFEGVARPDEFYTFQIAVYPVKSDVRDVEVLFSDLKSAKGVISKDSLRCFNLGGINLKGDRFTKEIIVEEGKVVPLWIGVQIPVTAKGIYKGVVTVGGSNVSSTQVDIELDVAGDAAENHGFNESSSMSRLAWLDSQVGVSDSPTSPYVPIDVDDNKIDYLGGTVVIGKNGLPCSITTHYDEMNNLDKSVSNAVIGSPMEFIVETDKGIESFTTSAWMLKKDNDGVASWVSKLVNENFTIEVLGRFEFDGSSECSLKLTSLNDIIIKDIRLKIAYSPKSSKYIVGLGQKGGLRRNDSYLWSWDTVKHQDAIWMGDVNAGLNFKFKDKSYIRPLVNIYYSLGRLRMPVSWGNNSRGGIRYSETPQRGVDLEAYSGCRDMKRGESLDFDFEMLITPVKPLNFSSHVSNRYFQSNSDLSIKYIDKAKESGATQINIHSKKDIYPFINYPYYDPCIADFANFVERATKEGLKVGAYYTTRELTVKIPEIWALRALGGEIIHSGPGADTRTLIHPDGPNKWLIDNFKCDFIPAWYNAFEEGRFKGEMDISVITTPDSRWNNYYLSGLEWMVKRMNLSGVYIDDSALDRETLKRARRVVGADGKERLIDIHSWNHFNEWAGYANSLHMYLDLLPYVDRTWIGEGFTDSNDMDFWLIEMAGVPYGVHSEMLDAHNVFKGMIFGMTPRLGWSGDPTYLWRMYDSFGMKEAKMYGYWINKRVVSSGNDMLPVTTYVNHKTQKAVVVIASWADVSANGKLLVDVEELGFTPVKASLIDLGDIQHVADFDINSTFTIPQNGGVILIIE